MPKLTVFVVSAAKYLLKERRFLVVSATGPFVVFTLFSTLLFSMIAFTRRGFIQAVNDDSYYFINQAFAQEPGVEFEQIPTEEQPPSMNQQAVTEGGETI
jgi:hypothetical protein